MTAHGPVRVLSTTHLDARHAIYLVEAGDHMLVVGAGADSLSLLIEISSAQERAAIREKLQEGSGASFGSYLSSWVARMSGGEARHQLDAGKDFLAGRLEGMRRLRQERKSGNPDAES